MQRLPSASVQHLLTLCLAVLATIVLSGCGGAEPSGDTTPKGASSAPLAPTSAKPAESAAPPTTTTARDRLQGTWEIARFQSDKGIPDEAMPVMSTLFSKVRLEFSGRSAIARIEGSGAQEIANFDVGNESGDNFTLFAPGWMFNGAQCRFTAAGAVEVKDIGERWPGVTSLKRVP